MTAVTQGAGGLGSVVFVGGGAAVMDNAVLLEFYGPLVQRTIEFWITVGGVAFLLPLAPVGCAALLPTRL